jgi:hypothetical protein
MIETPTVLILGAGASRPYGFPTGMELRAEICAAANKGSGFFPDTFYGQSSIDETDVIEFAKAFRDSAIHSIDSFIDKRPNFDFIGRVCISAALARKEHAEDLFDKTYSGNWYAVLWNRLIDGVGRPEELSRNKLTIFTFNYDRSLEQFLFLAIKNTFGLTSTAAHAHVARIPIVHIYGQLGKFSVTEDRQNYRMYSRDFDSFRGDAAANGLTIINRTSPEDEIFQSARKQIGDASELYYLGFGFDHMNCNRLDVTRALKPKIQSGLALPQIYATTLGLTQRQIDIALQRAASPSHGWQHLSLPVHEAIRHWPLGT